MQIVHNGNSGSWHYLQFREVFQGLLLKTQISCPWRDISFKLNSPTSQAGKGSLCVMQKIWLNVQGSNIAYSSWIWTHLLKQNWPWTTNQSCATGVWFTCSVKCSVLRGSLCGYKQRSTHTHKIALFLEKYSKSNKLLPTSKDLFLWKEGYCKEQGCHLTIYAKL